MKWTMSLIFGCLVGFLIVLINHKDQIGDLKTGAIGIGKIVLKLEKRVDALEVQKQAALPSHMIRGGDVYDISTVPGGSWIFVPVDKKPGQPLRMFDRPGLLPEHRMAAR